MNLNNISGLYGVFTYHIPVSFGVFRSVISGNETWVIGLLLFPRIVLGIDVPDSALTISFGLRSRGYIDNFNRGSFNPVRILHGKAGLVLSTDFEIQNASGKHMGNRVVNTCSFDVFSSNAKEGHSH